MQVHQHSLQQKIYSCVQARIGGTRGAVTRTMRTRGRTRGMKLNRRRRRMVLCPLLVFSSPTTRIVEGEAQDPRYHRCHTHRHSLSGTHDRMKPCVPSGLVSSGMWLMLDERRRMSRSTRRFENHQRWNATHPSGLPWAQAASTARR